MAGRPPCSEPSDELILALDDFAKANGHQWRSKLRRYWCGDNPKADGLLRQVRNQHLPWFERQTTATIDQLAEYARYREAAYSLHSKDDIKIGAIAACKPAVSDSEEGAWVQAWVFVPVEAVQKEKANA